MDGHRSHIDPAVRGDRRAQHALLASLLPRVRNLVRYLVRGDRDVDDLAQEALVAIVAGLPSFRNEGSLESWADRVTARATFAGLRRRRVDGLHVIPTSEPPEVAIEGNLDEVLHRRRAVSLLDRLSDEQRHALVLHHVLEWSVPEAAALLDVSAETFRSRLRLGRNKLRSLRDAEDAHSDQAVPIEEAAR